MIPGDTFSGRERNHHSRFILTFPYVKMSLFSDHHLPFIVPKIFSSGRDSELAFFFLNQTVKL